MQDKSTGQHGINHNKEEEEEEEEEDSILGRAANPPFSPSTITTTANNNNIDNIDNNDNNNQGEKNSNFSPLLSTQGMMVIQEVKSSKKYVDKEASTLTKLTVTERGMACSLFQNEVPGEDEKEMESAIEKLQQEIELSKDLDNSINMDEFFQPPPTSHSLLEDETSTLPAQSAELSNDQSHSSPSPSPSVLSPTSSARRASGKESKKRTLTPRASLRDGTWVDGFERESLIPLPSPILDRDSGDHSLSLVRNDS